MCPFLKIQFAVSLANKVKMQVIKLQSKNNVFVITIEREWPQKYRATLPITVNNNGTDQVHGLHKGARCQRELSVVESKSAPE